MASFEDEQRLQALRGHLALVGVASARELCQKLGVSQAAFSRLVSRHPDALLVIGRGRATRYAARRTIVDIEATIPVFGIGPDGSARRLATLHPVLAEAFWVESHDDTVPARYFSDLPYFLNDLRPSGYLGRLIAKEHAELGHPSDIRLWSADHCLRYLARLGWDTVGNWIVGTRAMDLYLERRLRPAPGVAARERARRYPELAADVLARGRAGSSAAGEQPKFLTTKLPEGTDVLVKFSPPVTDSAGRRGADLLIAEHLAHRVLAKHGMKAAHSELVFAGERAFLEVERFDRTAAGGRLGVLSLYALDAEFVGSFRSWSESARRLVELGHLGDATCQEIAWAETFGRLIANDDMHFANLALFTDGTRVVGLAPLYDMTPALYAAAEGNVTTPLFDPRAPAANEAAVWDSASRAALDFWASMAKDVRVSEELREVAQTNRGIVERWREVARHLPG